MTAQPSTDPPGLDAAALRSYLDSVVPGLVAGPLRAEIIAGGRSNLTYVVTDGVSTWVLRRPPLGHVLATAHDMGREYRVLSALRGTPVPVPTTILHCPDPSVIGAPFYLMEHVAGEVYRSAAQTAALGPDRVRALSGRLIDVLADLHAVDPAKVGLADFGRPEGFLERQVRRWRTQLDASRSRPLPGADDLAAALAARVPPSGAPAIVHGDYRLDNVLVLDDRITAVLDWEMATLGDPLTDLGLFLVYWDGLASLPGNAVSSAVHPDLGFPPGAELVARYAERTGADVDRLGWYLAFGYFKLAVIAEGIHYRYVHGQTVGAGFDRMGDLVYPLLASGLAAVREDP